MVLVSPILAFALAPIAPHIAQRTRVERAPVSLASRSIRLVDVLPTVRGDVRNVVIATLPVGRDRVALSSTAIKVLVRRAVPGLVVGNSIGETVTFVLRRPIARPERSGQCSVLRVSVAAGAAIEPAMVARAACSNARPVALTFDRAAALSSTASLAAGAYLGRLSLPVPGLRSGEAVTLVSTSGPVRIVRAVTTLQASRGRRVFVRDADGQVFSVRRAELAR